MSQLLDDIIKELSEGNFPEDLMAQVLAADEQSRKKRNRPVTQSRIEEMGKRAKERFWMIEEDTLEQIGDCISELIF